MPPTRFAQILKNCDIYGEQVHINYRGDRAFRTWFGALVTILVLAGMTIYGTIKFTKLFTRAHPEQFKSTIIMDKDEQLNQQFEAQENRFGFAFGFIEMDTWNYKTYDPRYFSIVGRRIDMLMSP